MYTIKNYLNGRVVLFESRPPSGVANNFFLTCQLSSRSAAALDVDIHSMEITFSTHSYSRHAAGCFAQPVLHAVGCLFYVKNDGLSRKMKHWNLCQCYSLQIVKYVGIHICLHKRSVLCTCVLVGSMPVYSDTLTWHWLTLNL